MGFGGLILLLAVISGIVSFLLAVSLRSSVLAVIAGAVITEMLFLIWGLTKVATSNSPYVEDVFLAVNVTFMVSTPVVIMTSIGVVVAVRCIQRKRKSASVDDQV